MISDGGGVNGEEAGADTGEYAILTGSDEAVVGEGLVDVVHGACFLEM